ncbi:PAS domain-containing protein [Halorubrum vacuolatum]|uniref:PAS domain S-box-containing protein n=1 Tax=Halorubrum vacuolatum TaxID=63740 RepID=A0A238Y7P3_HALVU|nr:PAS domain S-box protein [Halorubrum vacuolatum]SNR67245.1 PAS domain S-box-containing protein [Halorubrum vacuolatum]
MSDTPPDSSTDPPRIYPLVADQGNERVLKEWLVSHDTYALADVDEPVEAGAFDLCIVDRGGIETFSEELQRAKSDADPVLLPVLLLVPEAREGIIETDRGEIADNVLRTGVDEIVMLPIRQVELEWRIRALLRLRDQSLTLDSNVRQLSRFKQAAEAAGHAIFVTDLEGHIEYANPAFEEITGYDREEVIGDDVNVLSSGGMSDAYYADLWETITAGETFEAEIVNHRKDGSEYTAYQTIAPILDDTGEITAYVAVQMDITEQKNLRERLKRHRDIVQRLSDPIMIQDESGRFELVNEALAEFAGLPAEELLGTDEVSFMDADSSARIARKKREVMETESPMGYSISPEFERSGKEAVFDTRRYPFYDHGGELTGTFAICRDVTELKERARQLRVLDNILRHNLRNDLTVIRGRADQLRSETDGELAEMAETIVTYADALMTTGEKSRAITNLLSEEPESVRIDLSRTAALIADRIDASELVADVTVDTPERAIASVTVNIEKAIEELVRNAIIHNDRAVPSVTLCVTTAGDAVELRVVDDGPGLSEMDRDVLTTGQAVDSLYHGSGLGLWLVYWTVRRSDGSIAVAEADPRGTEITLRLPAPVAE